MQLKNSIGALGQKKPNGVKAKRAVISTRSFSAKIYFALALHFHSCMFYERWIQMRPFMPFLYDMLDTAKEKIQDVCGGSKREYMPYWNMIDQR